MDSFANCRPPSTPEQSAALREKLLTALGNITSSDSAAIWAREALAAKNRLVTNDAKRVEDAFEQRLTELAPSATAEVTDDAAPKSDAVDVHELGAKEHGNLDRRNGIDKSALVIATPRRYRNREHLRYVAQQACLVCGRKQCDPHHLRYMQPRALGRKVSDEFAVPLCRSHHRAVHRAVDEQSWWTAAGIDPVTVARQLWQQTRSMIRQILNRQISRHAQTVNRLLRALTMRGNQRPIRLSQTGWTTVERREQHGRPVLNDD
jgi:hypothetical protein